MSSIKRYLNLLRLRPEESIRILKHGLEKRYYWTLHWKAPVYSNPTEIELGKIEDDLVRLGIRLDPIVIDEKEYRDFDSHFPFPANFCGGKRGLRDEKVFEHFLAYKFCNLGKFGNDETYIDIAGAASPWIDILRARGYNATSVDLEVPKQFSCHPGYRKMDATNTDFKTSTISACSMQCAFEMFVGQSDCQLIREAGRFLKPQARFVISPLYMHTHHCGYSSPEYYKKGFADERATEYINRDSWGIPFSRKYSANLLKERILDLALDNGFSYNISVISNKKDLGNNIYCHFVLVLTKNET